MTGDGSVVGSTHPDSHGAAHLGDAARVLVVCAHPDDESFGLGAVIAAMAQDGTEVDLLCFTRGEESTLGASVNQLAAVRSGELAAAAGVLGVATTDLLAYADGGLAEVALAELAGHIDRHLTRLPADALLVFDEGGITGHPDHCRATGAAVAAADRHGLPVLGWAVPDAVARALNTEFGTGFVGRPPEEIDADVVVDRARQLEAIACHTSQSTDNPVLWRRLTLQGPREVFRWLRRPPRLSQPIR